MNRRCLRLLSRTQSSRGYSLIELLIAMGVLSVVAGTMIRGVLNMTKVNGAIQIRSEMHSSVRNATELLQQEVGQAADPPGDLQARGGAAQKGAVQIEHVQATHGPHGPSFHRRKDNGSPSLTGRVRTEKRPCFSFLAELLRRRLL